MIDSKNPRQKLIFDEYNDNHSEYHEDLSQYKKDLLEKPELEYDSNYVKEHKRKTERSAWQQYCRKPFAQFQMDILFAIVAFGCYYYMMSPFMKQKGLCTPNKKGSDYVPYYSDSEKRDAQEWVFYQVDPVQLDDDEDEDEDNNENNDGDNDGDNKPKEYSNDDLSDLQKFLIEDTVTCSGIWMLHAYIWKPVIVLALLKLLNPKCRNKSFYGSKTFQYRVTYDFVFVFGTGLTNFEMVENYSIWNVLYTLVPVFILEAIIYATSVLSANTQAEKIIARMIQVRIETVEQHEDMYSSCEEIEEDEIAPNRNICKLNSKISLTSKMLQQVEYGEKDTGFEVSLDKAHKPIFVCFIDLLYFLTASFVTFTYLWANQNNKKINLFKETFKIVSYNLVLLLKFIYDVIYIKFMSKKQMNSSQSTSGLFWSRVIFCLICFELVFLLKKFVFDNSNFESHDLKKKRGLVAPFLLLFFVIDFFIYHFCVKPAYYRMCYQRHVDKKFDPEQKKKIEANYKRKKYIAEKDKGN